MNSFLLHSAMFFYGHVRYKNYWNNDNNYKKNPSSVYIRPATISELCSKKENYSLFNLFSLTSLVINHQMLLFYSKKLNKVLSSKLKSSSYIDTNFTYAHRFNLISCLLFSGITSLNTSYNNEKEKLIHLIVVFLWSLFKTSENILLYPSKKMRVLSVINFLSFVPFFVLKLYIDKYKKQVGFIEIDDNDSDNSNNGMKLDPSIINNIRRLHSLCIKLEGIPMFIMINYSFIQLLFGQIVSVLSFKNGIECITGFDPYSIISCNINDRDINNPKKQEEEEGKDVDLNKNWRLLNNFERFMFKCIRLPDVMVSYVRGFFGKTLDRVDTSQEVLQAS